VKEMAENIVVHAQMVNLLVITVLQRPRLNPNVINLECNLKKIVKEMAENIVVHAKMVTLLVINVLQNPVAATKEQIKVQKKTTVLFQKVEKFIIL
jgi:hypothetical protein